MIHDTILEFLRDAQYRVGELGTEINDLLNIGEVELPAKKHRKRLELMMFMKVLYDIQHKFSSDDYSFVLTNDATPTYAEGWSENMILAEIEYLRVYTGMTEMPLLDFTPYWTDVVNIISSTPGGEGANFPEGTPGQMLMYNASGVIQAIDPDPYGGMGQNENINDYFSGRT